MDMTARRAEGILPAQELRALLARGGVSAMPALLDDQIQPASIDLRLGDFAYPLDASFLPGRGVSVQEKMAQLDPHYERFRIDLREGAVLEKGRLYLIPLLEHLALPEALEGRANPKSSTGRLDILTRLIIDGGDAFDSVRSGYRGALYLEVVPWTFSVVARTGDRLNQLRFRRLSPDRDTDGAEPRILRFTVDLQADGTGGALIGFRARKHTPRIDLARRDYDPLDFWEPLRARAGRPASLVLDPGEFYILMTREEIAVPPDYAAEMLPYDTGVGEFRVHYAGFFDPGFGWDAQADQAGRSRGVLEVRSHEVPFLLEHGQVVGMLRYERMAALPDLLYGAEGSGAHYQNQKLKLAKQFLPLE
jgi:dCTP deaminase